MFKTRIVMTTILLSVILVLTGCTGVFFIPGASYGYYLWEEEGNIFVEWSVDKKDTTFQGIISTDGRIDGYDLINWEVDKDTFDIDKQVIEFSATLDGSDYSDGISFALHDYTYIEFDLKINDGYDLSRINVGGFLESPQENVFRIDKNYFNRVRTKPWYSRHPFSEFFYKLFSNKYFTFIYIFLLGIIVIEILRITVFSRKKRKGVWLAISYAVLIATAAVIYLMLYFFNR